MSRQSNVDESKKPGTKDFIIYDFIYMTLWKSHNFWVENEINCCLWWGEKGLIAREYERMSWDAENILSWLWCWWHEYIYQIQNINIRTHQTTLYYLKLYYTNMYYINYPSMRQIVKSVILLIYKLVAWALGIWGVQSREGSLWTLW